MIHHLSRDEQGENTDTFTFPWTYRPACQEYDLRGWCDAPQEYIFIDSLGRDIRVCAQHARRSYQWPGRHQCDVNDIDHGRCESSGIRIWHTVDGDEQIFCSFHFAFMEMYSTDNPKYEQERARLAEIRAKAMRQAIEKAQAQEQGGAA